MGFLQVERFLATRAAAEKQQKEVFTAQNSLEMRLSENISIRAFRRMRRVLSSVWDRATGKWMRCVLAEVPKHKGKGTGGGGGAGAPSKEYLKKNKIYPNRPVYSPSPIASDTAIAAEADRLLKGRKLEVAIPSRDGFSGAAWDWLDVAKDVFVAVGGLCCVHCLE